MTPSLKLPPSHGTSSLPFFSEALTSFTDPAFFVLLIESTCFPYPPIFLSLVVCFGKAGAEGLKYRSPRVFDTDPALRVGRVVVGFWFGSDGGY